MAICRRTAECNSASTCMRSSTENDRVLIACMTMMYENGDEWLLIGSVSITHFMSNIRHT